MERAGYFRWAIWGVPLIIGCVLAILIVGRLSVPAKGSGHFVKYALRENNNAVIDPASAWRRRWTFTAAEPLQEASWGNGSIYVGGDGGDRTNLRDNRLYAVNAKNGFLMWSKRLNNMIMTTPVVSGSWVYVGTGTQQFGGDNISRENRLKERDVIRGTGPSAVWGIQAKTGHVLWKHDTRGEDMPSFLIDGRTLFTVDGSGLFEAMNRLTGQVKWSVKLPSYVSMASLTEGGRLIFVSGAHPYQLYAINRMTRRLQWATPLPGVFGGTDDSSPAYAHSRLYLEGTRGTWQHPISVVFALNAKNGHYLWERTLGSGILPTDIEVSAPVVQGNRVYVGSPITDKEYALDATSGRIQWSFQALGGISESAALTSRHLYVGDSQGFLYVLDPQNGSQLGGRYLSGAFAADFPIVVGKTIYQPDENGQLFALPRSSLLFSREHHRARMPMPPGALGNEIWQGEALFMGHGLKAHESCDTCHLDAGTITTYQKGHVVNSLLGKAASFPLIQKGHVLTLDDEINHCLKGIGMGPWRSGDPRLKALDVYVHWLSSGWPNSLNHPSGGVGGANGGCQ